MKIVIKILGILISFYCLCAVTIRNIRECGKDDTIYLTAVIIVFVLFFLFCYGFFRPRI